MLARRFLWVITVIILLLVAGALAYRLLAPQLMRIAFVPSIKFAEDKAPPGPDYRDPGMWIARPDAPNNPAIWTPTVAEAANEPAAPTNASTTTEQDDPAEAASMPKATAAVFFVHPTTYLEKSHWNAPLDDAESRNRAVLFVETQASAFNAIGKVWAPRYRQATVGTFLTGRGDADSALALAYGDVLAAFDEFLRNVPSDRPIILAGHSQGSYHVARLMAERVAGKPLARRIAAAYVIGWPLSVTIDVPRLGLPACTTADQSGCIVSWLSFAEPANPKQLMAVYDASAGPSGQSRAGTPPLCVNPLTGNAGDSATADKNLGTIVPDATLTTATLRAGLVPARCDARGLLLIGDSPPAMPPFVLPGNNYHVFDYALFWANIRQDAARRLARFEAR